MNGTEAYWKKHFRDRFGDREDIGKEGLYVRYYENTDIPKEALLELLELIEIEFDLSPGLLRPEDKLSKLIDPVETKNPWRWLVYQARSEDRKSELNYKLANRMRQSGTTGRRSQIETLDDLVRAWCGLTPS